jgi:hypothetical protein
MAHVLDLLSAVVTPLAGVLLATLLLVLRSSQRAAALLAVQADAAGRGLAATPEELSERLHQAAATVESTPEVVAFEGA